MGAAYRFADILFRKVIPKTGDYTAKLTEDSYLYSGASAALGLPTAVGCKGKRYFIGHFGTSGTHVYTIDPNGAETIGGLATLRLVCNGDFVVIESDNANWFFRSKNIKVSASYRNTAGTGYLAASGTVDVPFATKVQDHRAFFASPTATIEYAGEYEAEAQVGTTNGIFTTAQFQNLTLVHNGSAVCRDRKNGNGDLGAIPMFNKVSTKLQCAVSDTIKIQFAASVNLSFSSVVGDCFFNLTRIGD